MMTRRVFWLLVLAAGLLPTRGVLAAQDEKVAQLAKEVSGKGWIAYASRGDNGTWDLFLMRPDGSGRRNITNTPDYEEGGPRFSPDGKKLLYRAAGLGSPILYVARMRSLAVSRRQLKKRPQPAAWRQRSPCSPFGLARK